LLNPLDNPVSAAKTVLGFHLAKNPAIIAPDRLQEIHIIHIQFPFQALSLKNPSDIYKKRIFHVLKFSIPGIICNLMTIFVKAMP
jgi:hypothetical protein